MAKREQRKDKKDKPKETVILQEFIDGFKSSYCKINPRPPVPGEENDRSNCGASTRSSGSYHSHISGRSASSHHSDISHKSQSPSATPRKSNLDKTLTPNRINGSESKDSCDDLIAPLGFEPEGSVASSPQFTESSSQPAYFKWAKDLKFILEDAEGVKLFRQFLSQHQCLYMLSFYFASEGLKYVEPKRLNGFIKVIFERFVKGDELRLSSETKRKIYQNIKNHQLNIHIFDEAQAEVEKSMRDLYPIFLQSDIYQQYVARGGESPKSNNSSGSDCCHSALSFLLTVHDTKTDISNISLGSTIPLVDSSLSQTKKVHDSSAFVQHEHFLPPSACQAPKRRHLSFNPVSAENSGFHSSETMTDDAMSHAGGSQDGETNKKVMYKREETIFKNPTGRGFLNQTSDLSYPHRPRTEMMQHNFNLASTDPNQFAYKLITKLKELEKNGVSLDRYGSESDIQEMEVLALKKDTTETKQKTLKVCQPSMLSSELVRNLEEGAENILEEHVSRIWENGVISDQNPSFSRSGYMSDDATKRQIIHPSPNVSSCMLGRSSRLSHHSAFVPSTRNPLNYQQMMPHVQSNSIYKGRGNGGGDWVGRVRPHHLHSTPKTKGNSRFCSQSDSETRQYHNHINFQRTYSNIPNSNRTWMPSGEWVSDRDQHAIYSSQPNLQDSLRLRVMQPFPRDQATLPSSFSSIPHVKQTEQTDRCSRLSLTELLSYPPVTLSQPSMPMIQSHHSSIRLDSNKLVGTQLPLTAKSTSPDDVTVVGYYFCEEPIPYRTTIAGKNITLGQFKQHLSKRDNYRYFFKTICNEFDSGVVHEEVFRDSDILPLWEGKIIGKVERKQ